MGPLDNGALEPVATFEATRRLVPALSNSVQRAVSSPEESTNALTWLKQLMPMEVHEIGSCAKATFVLSIAAGPAGAGAGDGAGAGAGAGVACVVIDPPPPPHPEASTAAAPAAAKKSIDLLSTQSPERPAIRIQVTGIGSLRNTKLLRLRRYPLRI